MRADVVGSKLPSDDNHTFLLFFFSLASCGEAALDTALPYVSYGSKLRINIRTIPTDHEAICSVPGTSDDAVLEAICCVIADDISDATKSTTWLLRSLD